MGKVFALGLKRVKEFILRAERGTAGQRTLATGERRVLEHVLMISAEKQLKMPRR